MRHSEGRFSGSRGRSVFFQTWQPADSPRAVILLAHGAGEHSQRYRELAEYFCSRGFAIIALDQAGHGRSEGTPGHIESIDDYLFDLRTCQNQMGDELTGLPLLLLGHSMGGLVACLYLLQHQAEFAGAILSGPAITSGLRPGFFQMWVLRILALVAPKSGALQLDAQGVSRDPEVVRKYLEDPLVHHGKMSVRKVRELFAGMSRIQERAGEIVLPMLILHGGADAMTDPDGSRFLHEHITSADKTLKIYPGLFHEIFNEPEREEVMADVLAWCEARIGDAPGR